MTFSIQEKLKAVPRGITPRKLKLIEDLQFMPCFLLNEQLS